jgi:hypothetical protein
MDSTPTRETEPQPIGVLLPDVLRGIAVNAEDELAAIRLRMLAARYEQAEDRRSPLDRQQLPRRVASVLLA